MSEGIPCTWMRGGTSKGAYFLARDLPATETERDALLLSVMGSPDPRQIDGIGGADPLTSKVAVVSVSDRPSADIDYPVPAGVRGPGRRHRPPELREHPLRGRPVRGREGTGAGRGRPHRDRGVHGQQRPGGRRDHRDAGRRGDLRRNRADRRSPRHCGAGAPELPGGGRLDLRRPAPHGERHGRDRRHRSHLHRQRHAGGGDAGVGPRHHRLRGTARTSTRTGRSRNGWNPSGCRQDR